MTVVNGLADPKVKALRRDKGAPRVSVIVPHYNDLSGLDLCLDRLMAQSFDRDDFEVIVADNNSKCGLDAVRQVAGDRARVVLAEEQGAGPARNAGYAASVGEIVAFTDSDCLPDDVWIEAGVAALQSSPIVGGQVRVGCGDFDNMTPTEAFEAVFSFDMEKYIREKGFCGSGNLFTTRTVFDDVGGFRAGVSEDVDWCWRAGAKGYKIAYSAEAAAVHPARREWDELVTKWRRVTKESYLLAQEQSFFRLRWLAKMLLIIVSIGPHAIKIILTPKLNYFRDRKNAIGILVRIRMLRVWLCLPYLVAGDSGR